MAARHALKYLDPVRMTAVCAIDGLTAVRTAGRRKSGSPRYVCEMWVRDKIARQEATRGPRVRTYRYGGRAAISDRLDAGVCERCGYVAEDPCQLDVDHIVRRVDGGGDEPENLAVLCACCHRLKTKLERTPGRFDWTKFMALETIA